MSNASALPGTVLPTSDEAFGRRILTRVTWRLVPLLCVLYGVNILDRNNAGVARVGMQLDLDMKDAAFDISLGLFYAGYLLFEVPSNLLMRRVGARRWIARILISWGLISSATLAVTGPISFSLMRILLGVAEAGFFPGIVLYMTYWFPAKDRARMMAYFMIGSAVAGVFGNPLSGWIMETFKDTRGLAGWQWLFLLEGIPSVLLGFVTLYALTDRPAEARWLTAEEREWLVARIKGEDADCQQRHGADKLAAMMDRRVWLLICIYFTVAVGTNASGGYLFKLVKEHFDGLGDARIGLLSALPHACAVIAMILLSRHSDRTHERPRHVAFAAAVAALGWMIVALKPPPIVALVGLCIAQAGMMSMLPVFWTMPTVFLTGVAAAGGIALINSVANIGGLIGSWVLGHFGLWSMVTAMVAGAILPLCVRAEKTAVPVVGGENRA